MDLLQEIQIDPHKIRYPNRDAKRLRDGFVYSQFDEENNRQMLLQQMNFNVNAYRALVDRMIAATSGVPNVAIHTPSDVLIGGSDASMYDPSFIDDDISSMSIEAMGAVAPQQQAAAAAASSQEQAASLIQQSYRKRKAEIAALNISALSFGDLDPDTQDIKIDLDNKIFNVYKHDKHKGTNISLRDAKGMIQMYNMKTLGPKIDVSKLRPTGRQTYVNLYLTELRKRGYKAKVHSLN